MIKMKTIFSYHTDIVKLCDNRAYHAVIISSKTDKGLEVKVTLESDKNKDEETLLGSCFSKDCDYAECYSHIYSLLNDQPFCDTHWDRYITYKRSRKNDESAD